MCIHFGNFSYTYDSFDVRVYFLYILVFIRVNGIDMGDNNKLVYISI